MDMRELIEDIITGVGVYDEQGADIAAETIIEHLPYMVVPLAWDGPNCGIWDSWKRFSGDCAAYKIIWDLGRVETYTSYFGNNRLGVYPTLSTAKKSANEHHRATIMSAFGITA